MGTEKEGEVLGVVREEKRERADDGRGGRREKREAMRVVESGSWQGKRKGELIRGGNAKDKECGLSKEGIS